MSEYGRQTLPTACLLPTQTSECQLGAASADAALQAAPGNRRVVHPRTVRYPHLEGRQHRGNDSKQNRYHQSQDSTPIHEPRRLFLLAELAEIADRGRVFCLGTQVVQPGCPKREALVEAVDVRRFPGITGAFVGERPKPERLQKHRVEPALGDLLGQQALRLGIPDRREQNLQGQESFV